MAHSDRWDERAVNGVDPMGLAPSTGPGSATEAGRSRRLVRAPAVRAGAPGDTVALAVRRLRQDQIAADLHSGLDTADVAWLDADLG